MPMAGSMPGWRGCSSRESRPRPDPLARKRHSSLSSACRQLQRVRHGPGWSSPGHPHRKGRRPGSSPFESRTGDAAFRTAKAVRPAAAVGLARKSAPGTAIARLSADRRQPGGGGQKKKAALARRLDRFRSGLPLRSWRRPRCRRSPWPSPGRAWQRRAPRRPSRSAPPDAAAGAAPAPATSSS